MVLLVLVLVPVLAGSASQPLPHPDLDLWRAGSVSDIAVWPDATFVVGGEFQTVGRLPRRNIARLGSARTVDSNWVVDVNGPVRALAIDPAGRVYVGGEFSTVNGVPRSGLARLAADGQLDLGWNPAPAHASGARVLEIEIFGQHVYVAGRFTAIAGQSRSHIARFSTSSGTIDTDWSPAIDSSSGISAIFTDGGNLYLNGGAEPGASLSRVSLSGSGAADDTWTPVVGGGEVRAMTFAPQGSIFIGGTFDSVQGQPRAGLARLSTAAGAAIDPVWSPPVDGYVNTLEARGGLLYLGGSFRAVSGRPRANLAAVFDSDEGPSFDLWTPDTYNGEVRKLLSRNVFDLIVGGDFSQIRSQPRAALALVTFATPANIHLSDFVETSAGQVLALLPLPDGGLLVGGRFHRAGDVYRQNLMRLSASGQPDTQWHADVNGLSLPYLQPPGAPGGFVFQTRVDALALDGNGRIYVGGAFTQVGAQPRANVARLQADGQVDASWNPGTDGLVSAIAPSAGNVFLGGNFHHVAGQARGSLAKLGDGPGAILDPLWQANLDASAWVVDLALDSAGALFVGGNGFQSVNGEICCLNLLKLAATGSGARDPIWNVRPTGSQRIVTDLLLDTQDRLYIAGRFDGINQGGNLHAATALARVSSTGTGTVDAAWTPITAASISVGVSSVALGPADQLYATAFGPGSASVGAWSTLGNGAAIPGWQLDADAPAGPLAVSGHTLFVGGEFSEIGGRPRRGLAAFATDGVFRDSFE
jgi:uncharacterized delta-60 repeat protein